MESKEYLDQAAVLVAAQNMGIDPKEFNNSQEVMDAWVAMLADAGLTAEQIEPLVKKESDNFARELIAGKFGEQLAEADLCLTAWGEVPGEELEALKSGLAELAAQLPEEPKKRGRAPAAPKEVVLKEIPLGIEVGDVIEVAGSSWQGFDALVTGIDQATGWLHVYTRWPKSGKEYRGKVRFEKAVQITYKGVGTWEALMAAKLQAQPVEADDVEPDPDPADNEAEEAEE